MIKMMYYIGMKLIGSLLLSIFVLACQTGPEPVTAPPTPPPAEPQAVAVEEVFEPENVAQDLYDTTMAEVRALIGELNRIIRARNYDVWVGYLANDYFVRINSDEFLEERTEELFRREQIIAANMGRTAQRRVLRNSRDYFDHIVVPSRSNDRVDDIDFLSRTSVRAYTIDSRGNTLILYDLENIDGQWKIVN